MTTHSVDAAGVSSPYRNINVAVNDGVLFFEITDPSIKDSDYKAAKLSEAVLITDEGRKIALKPWATNLGNGVTFLFKLKDVGFDDDHFALRVTVSLAGKTTTITGKFTVHSHFHIVDVVKELG